MITALWITHNIKVLLISCAHTGWKLYGRSPTLIFRCWTRHLYNQIKCSFWILPEKNETVFTERWGGIKAGVTSTSSGDKCALGRTAAGSHSSAQVCRCTHLCHQSFGLKERRALWSLTLSSSGYGTRLGHGTRLVHGTERPVSACSASGAANWWSASRHADRLTQKRSSQLASLLKPLLEMMAQITPDIPSHLRTQLPFSVIQARVSL